MTTTVIDRFDIYRKNKKALKCGICGKYCSRGEATKYYTNGAHGIVKLHRFVCRDCHHGFEPLIYLYNK